MLITNRVVEILARHPDIIVPVKQLWRDLLVAGITTALPLEDFAGLLEDDPRIEFMADLDFGNGDPDADLAMDALGFVSGPRVKLAARQLTAAHIARMLESSTHNLVNALKEAWNLRPDNDPEADLELLLAIDAAEELRRSVQEALAEELKGEQPADGDGT